MNIVKMCYFSELIVYRTDGNTSIDSILSDDHLLGG